MKFLLYSQFYFIYLILDEDKIFTYSCINWFASSINKSIQ